MELFKDNKIKNILLEQDNALSIVFNSVNLSQEEWEKIIKTPYVALMGAIIGQKIKYTTARTIRGRLYTYFNGSKFTITDIDNVTDSALLNIGMSLCNIKTIRYVNKYIRDNNLILDIDNIWELRNVKGIGLWTIKTTLLTSLLDLTVFPYDDIFLRNKVKKLYGLPKRPTAKEMIDIADKWQPYQSIVCWYLWRWFD